ncbi:MAG: hypothetical protein Q9182_005033 [Xanthomendoza sp. 2 TL-2023]
MASISEPPSSHLPTAPRLPDFLFDGWQLRHDDLSKAESREDLKGWNVSTLCSAYLRYQWDRLQLNNAPLSAPSLISASVTSILHALSTADNLQEDIKTIAENCNHAMLRHILKDPRTPYVVFRMLDALPQTSIHGKSGLRKLVDVDEAVLVSEQYVQTQKPKLGSSFLLTLNGLANILGFPNAKGVITFKRKTPPKGGFEFLDQKRKQSMQILGTDARWKETFDRATNGCLDGLDWNNVFIAGGVVLNTLLFTNGWGNDVAEPARKDMIECDIDLYLYGLTPDEANRKVEHIYDVWLRWSTSPDASTLCTVCLPVAHFVMSRSSTDKEYSAIETGYCVFTMDLIWGHHLSKRRETQEIRVFKYADRGFGIRLLPSYVRSLEQCAPEDVEQETEENRGGPARVFKGEPGLKTLKRIAHLGRDFVHRRLSQQDPPFSISLAALDGFRMHDDLPDRRNGLGVFELLIRHVEAWRLDAAGIAHWGANLTTSFDEFESGARAHDNRLFGILTRIIAQKLNIGLGGSRWLNYLTRRIRRMIVADDLETLYAKQITMPLIIPMDLEAMVFNELASRSTSVPADCLPRLIQVHDPRSHDPRTTTMPSLTDSASEQGNLRYWLITNKNMWAGQDRVADEVTELLTSLFDWYLNCEGPTVGPIRYGTDSERCIWHLARLFRRRLILPDIVEQPPCDAMHFPSGNRENRGQTLPQREARLFRPWALTRLLRVERTYVPDAKEADQVEDEMESVVDVDDDAFWRAGDEGTWDEEEGVPVWTD